MKSVLREVDSEDRKFGSGWLSGFLGLVMSLAGLATVLCFWYPQWLTVQDAHAVSYTHLTLPTTPYV